MPEITMNPVRSSNIAAVGYDPQSQTCRIQFHSLATWDYSPVPQQLYEQLVGAPSVGKFFITNIKGAYSGERVS